MVPKEVSVNVKTKNTFKYHYYSGFLFCLKNTYLQTIEIPKKAKKMLKIRTKLSVHARMLQISISHLRSQINFI